MLEALDKISNNYDFERKQEIKSDSYTLPESVEMYLTCKKISGLSENTIKNYRITLNTFFKTVQKAPSEIVANDIRFFLYNYQKERSVSSRSLDKYREYIVRFFLGQLKKDISTQTLVKISLLSIMRSRLVLP